VHLLAMCAHRSSVLVSGILGGRYDTLLIRSFPRMHATWRQFRSDVPGHGGGRLPPVPIESVHLSTASSQPPVWLARRLSLGPGVESIHQLDDVVVTVVYDHVLKAGTSGIPSRTLDLRPGSGVTTRAGS
jgi:hypothetical protein